MKELGKILYKESDIVIIVDKLARQLNRDYKHQTPVLVGVLNGSFVFMADLVRRLTFVHDIDFVQLASYKNNKSSGEVAITKTLTNSVESRSVLIIEDIVDSGLSIKYLKERLFYFHTPKDVRVCTLLNRCKTFKADYIGTEVESTKFLVGYGLDLDNQFRNLPYIIECGGD